MDSDNLIIERVFKGRWAWLVSRKRRQCRQYWDHLSGGLISLDCAQHLLWLLGVPFSLLEARTSSSSRPYYMVKLLLSWER